MSERTLSIDHSLKEMKDKEWMKMKLKKRLFHKTNGDCDATFWKEATGLSWWRPNKQTN